jgi:hypothetical protein
VFLKAPNQLQSYKQHLKNTPLPPEPVPTRWRTWIEEVNFYSERFETVKSIVARSPSESAVSVRESQSAFSDPKMVCSIAYILRNFGSFPESIKRSETQGLPLQEFITMLKRKPVFSTFTSVYQVLNRDSVDPPEDIAHNEIPLLKFATVTSCDVERSFSAYRHIPSDKRQPVTPENMEEIVNKGCMQN